MKRCFILLTLLALGVALLPAQTPEGAITPQLLADFHKLHAQKTPAGLTNIMANNTNLNDLSVNQANAQVDPYFAVKLDIKGITNQKSTGRCWLFTGLNVIRQKAREKLNAKEFEFSQNYNFFYDQLEKANLTLEGFIETRKKAHDDEAVKWLYQNALGDGGVWSMMVDIVEKYGVVPKSVMPDTKHGESTGAMTRMVRTKLREDGLRLRQMHQAGKPAKALRQAKTEMLGEIYRLLAMHLGEPPGQLRVALRRQGRQGQRPQNLHAPRLFQGRGGRQPAGLRHAHERPLAPL